MDVGLQESKYKKQVKYLLINISKIRHAETTLTTKRKFISARVSVNRSISIDVGDIPSVMTLATFLALMFYRSVSTTGDLCLISVSSEQVPGTHRCWAESYTVSGGHFSGMYCPYTQRAYWSQLFSHFCTVPTKQNLHSPGKTQPLPISHAEKKPNNTVSCTCIHTRTIVKYWWAKNFYKNQ